MRTNDERVERILNKTEILKRKRKIRIEKAVILSCIAAFIIAFELVLFVPHTVGNYNIAAFKNSEYYDLMDTIGRLTYSPHKTNYITEWGLSGGCGSAKGKDAAPGMGIVEGGSADAPSYKEVTNNQVDGIIEGDLFKRSADNIFYITNYDRYALLTIYDATDLSRVSSLEVRLSDENDERLLSCEMYLSSDCNTVTLILEEQSMARDVVYVYRTTAVNIDVSRPSSPSEKARITISGYYVSSRMINDELYVVTDFMVYRPDFDNEDEYLPQIGAMGNMQSLPMDEIVVPEDAQNAEYSIIAYLGSDLELKDSLALFSFSDILYVSDEHIFVTREIGKMLNKAEEHGTYSYSSDFTETACIEYDGKLTLAGTVTAEGTLTDQYSLDEHENKLRMFTTYDPVLRSFSGDDQSQPNEDYFKRTCNFFCFDLNTFELVASVENFADEDESVKSVRFEGEKAYVCTAVEKYDYEFDIHYIIDPVFEFDLGDLDNISYTSTGTIPGYSLSLIKFGGDLLGIGYGDKSDTLKIELYHSDDDKVIPIAKYEFYECEFSSDFKAYFIDAENLLVGLSVAYYDTAAKATVNRFLLLKFDGTEFVTVGLYDCEGSLNTTRACYDDGRVLLFNTNTARIIELPR